jgi:hypothetical protein
VLHRKFLPTVPDYLHKTKHGLTIQTGLSWVSNNDQLISTQFSKLHLVCYDRKKDLLDIPLGTREMSSSDIRISDYYNVLALLNFGEKLNTEIKRTMQSLGTLIRYVCENHMIHAINCGENYVPYSRVENTADTFDVKIFRNPDAFSPQETELLLGIL